MIMRISQLTTYWNAGDAQLIISFLDELKELLWATYGDEIIGMHQNDDSCRQSDDDDQGLEFDDEIPF